VTARIVVHSLEHALAAAEAAASLDMPVTLESAPGAGTYAGAAWFLAVVAEAQVAHPAARLDAILDCADEPGSALAALRAGCQRVRFAGRSDAGARLAEIASAMGATIETGAPGPALDLLSRRDPRAACRAWLAERPDGASI
jgi:hypothetical protein